MMSIFTTSPFGLGRVRHPYLPHVVIYPPLPLFVMGAKGRLLRQERFNRRNEVSPQQGTYFTSVPGPITTQAIWEFGYGIAEEK